MPWSSGQPTVTPFPVGVDKITPLRACPSPSRPWARSSVTRMTIPTDQLPVKLVKDSIINWQCRFRVSFCDTTRLRGQAFQVVSMLSGSNRAPLPPGLMTMLTRAAITVRWRSRGKASKASATSGVPKGRPWKTSTRLVSCS